MDLRRLVENLALTLISPRAQTGLAADLMELDAEAEATKVRLSHTARETQRRGRQYAGGRSLISPTTIPVERAIVAAAGLHLITAWLVRSAIWLVVFLGLLVVAALLTTALLWTIGAPQLTVYDIAAEGSLRIAWFLTNLSYAIYFLVH